MSDDAQNPYLLYPERAVQKRVRYYDGQFLGSADFILAQTHSIDRHRRHLAGTVTAGVLDGYAVHGEADAVVISPGTAVDGEGRPLVLAANARRAIQAADRGRNHTLWARYKEEASDDSSEDKGAAGMTRFDETPEIMYTPDGTALPDGVVILARLQVDGQGDVNVDTTVRPRAGLKVPGPIPITLTGDDADPGRGTLAGALKIQAPEGTAIEPTRPDLDVAGFGRFTKGLIVGQESNVGYQGVTNDVNDLVVNGQFAAGGSAGSAIFKLGVGMPPPGEGQGTLTAQRLAVGNGHTGGYGLRVSGTANFEGVADFRNRVWAAQDVQLQGRLDTFPQRPANQADREAGMIGYQKWSNGLDIVGATDSGNYQQRRITFHAQGGSRHVGDLRVEDDLYATRHVSAGQNLSAATDLGVGRNATVAGHTRLNTATITGDTRSNALFDGHDVNVRNRLTTQHLTHTGSASLNNIGVGGVANLDGHVNVRGPKLDVTPQADFAERVRMNGDLLQVTNRLMPSAGSDNSKGIVWPGQGNNDVGAIRFWKEGNNTRLVIDNQNNADDVIVLRQKGGDRLTVQNGRVGINHSTPAQTLHVGGTAQVDSHLWVDGALVARHRIQPAPGWGSGSADCGIHWGNNLFGGGGDFAGLFYNRVGDSGEATALVLENENDANDKVVIRQASADRLTVKAGKVGINEVEPAYSLDVSGTMRATGNVRVDGVIDLGAKHAGRETNAGMIKYHVHSNDSLEIIGAGTNGSNRRVRIWTEGGMIVHGWAQYDGGVKLHGSDFALGTRGTNCRAVWGTVKSNGAKWTGEGFSCERYGGHGGVFRIYFDVHFRNRPTVVVTQHYPNDTDGSDGWGNTGDNAIVSRVYKNWFQCVTGDGNGNRTWRSFEFIAIGRV